MSNTNQLSEFQKFMVRNSLYGINPEPPSIEQLASLGVLKNPNTAEDCRRIWEYDGAKEN